MSTSTATLTESNHSSRQLSSVSSLSASQPSQPSSIARIYKQSSQLFVTRRIKEALETLQPLIQSTSSPPPDNIDGESYDQSESQPSDPQPPQIASASRGARVKVWSLYISIVNEIVELGWQTGKEVFGASSWKQFAAEARDGSIWAEVVDNGYAGAEGDVDAEVVANLATLLLAHAPNQKLTQQRLETYLSASSAPPFDVTGHMERHNGVQRATPPNGTSTPRDLNSKLKILEIYTLHVLPRNAEWEYAREFITMSEILDEERKEAFIQALRNIQDEKEFDSKREEELQKQRDQQLADARRRDEDLRKAQQNKLSDSQSRRRDQANQRISEHDYGIDRSQIGARSKPASNQPNGSGAPIRASGVGKNRSSRPSTDPSAVSGSSRSVPPTFYRRFAFLVGAIQNGVVAMGRNVRSHPGALLRMLAFIFALIMALSRRDIRDRLSQAREASWNRLKRTVGMGVKVSYI